MSLYPTEIQNAASKILGTMSLREKIGQMVQFNSRNLKYLRKMMSDQEILERYPFGSYFSGSDVIDLIGHRVKGRDLIEPIQKASRIPLLIAGDLEEGAGDEELPSLTVLGATGDTKLAYDFGKVLAKRARCYGFHWTYGPVADIVMNWLAPNSATRALGIFYYLYI